MTAPVAAPTAVAHGRMADSTLPGAASPEVAPQPARRRRGVWGWIVIAIALLVVTSIGTLFASGAGQQKDPLDPDSAGPTGTRALVQVLRAHGVEVTVARDRQSALSALDSGSVTLVMPDSAYLSDDALSELWDAAADVILISPTSRSVRLLFPGAASAGYASHDLVDPACDQPDAERAGAVVPGELFDTGDDPTTIGCYPADGAYGLLSANRTSTSRAIAVDARELFTNEHIAENGNAALAIGLMGRSASLVWYVPSPADTDLTDGNPSLGELTPPWVTPAIVLLACAAVAGGVWRGRRFGPLVAEDLPVTVRASETMEGRARLYRRTRDPSHALDALRSGAVDRIARLLGLGPTASPGEVADAAADRLGARRELMRGILIDTTADSDRALIAASDRLRELEAAVRASVRTERNPS